MAYLKMNLAEKELERLFPNIHRFKHVQYLDLNTNALTEVAVLTSMPNLLHLNVSKNQLSTL